VAEATGGVTESGPEDVDDGKTQQPSNLAGAVASKMTGRERKS